MRPSFDCAAWTVAAPPLAGLARLAGISVAATAAAAMPRSATLSFMRVPFVWLAWLTSVLAEDPAAAHLFPTPAVLAYARLKRQGGDPDANGCPPGRRCLSCEER